MPLPTTLRWQVVTAPDSNVGDDLRLHTLLMARLDASVQRACGVTRCRARDPSDTRKYADYVSESCTTDPGLFFHVGAGATVGALVPDYRPLDLVNLGYGVMITYELRDR